MNKEYQFYILQELAKIYPYRSRGIIDNLIEKSEGDTREEKEAQLIKNVFVLHELGYIKDFAPRISTDGKMIFDPDFSITVKGLRIAGCDILEDPREELIKRLLNIAENKHNVQGHNLTILNRLLGVLPEKVLEKLIEKGLENLVALLSL